MKTISYIILLSGLMLSCSKEMASGPDRSETGKLGKKNNGITVSLYKDGAFLDEAETNFSGSDKNSTLETFDRDITISFVENGLFWQVSNKANRKNDTLNISIVHKEQPWCGHCTFFNGNYSLEVTSKVKAVLIDRTTGIASPLNKNETILYRYNVSDDSDQENRFIIVLR